MQTFSFFARLGDLDALENAGVRSIITLNGAHQPVDYTSIKIEKTASYDFIDGAGNDPALFLRAVDTLQRFQHKHAPVFVHCHQHLDFLWHPLSQYMHPKKLG